MLTQVPPISLRSISATVLPEVASRPTRGGPAWPAPMTIASKDLLINRRICSSEDPHQQRGTADSDHVLNQCGGPVRAERARERDTGSRTVERTDHRADYPEREAGNPSAARQRHSGSAECAADDPRAELHRHFSARGLWQLVGDQLGDCEQGKHVRGETESEERQPRAL